MRTSNKSDAGGGDGAMEQPPEDCDIIGWAATQPIPPGTIEQVMPSAHGLASSQAGTQVSWQRMLWHSAGSAQVSPSSLGGGPEPGAHRLSAPQMLPAGHGRPLLQ